MRIQAQQAQAGDVLKLPSSGAQVEVTQVQQGAKTRVCWLDRENPEEPCSRSETLPPTQIVEVARPASLFGDDPKPEPEGEKLKITYSPAEGILACGETYAHRAALKAVGYPYKFRYSRNLPKGCAWYVPRTRNSVIDRSDFDQLVRAVEAETGPGVVEAEFTLEGAIGERSNQPRQVEPSRGVSNPESRVRVLRWRKLGESAENKAAKLIEQAQNAQTNTPRRANQAALTRKRGQRLRDRARLWACMADHRDQWAKRSGYKLDFIKSDADLDALFLLIRNAQMRVDRAEGDLTNWEDPRPITRKDIAAIRYFGDPKVLRIAGDQMGKLVEDFDLAVALAPSGSKLKARDARRKFVTAAENALKAADTRSGGKAAWRPGKNGERDYHHAINTALGRQRAESIAEAISEAKSILKKAGGEKAKRAIGNLEWLGGRWETYARIQRAFGRPEDDRDLQAAAKLIVETCLGKPPSAVEVKETKIADWKERAGELERAKIPGYFPTPANLASKAAQRIVQGSTFIGAIQPGETILEPSAGSGSLLRAVEAIMPAGTSITALELVPRLAEHANAAPDSTTKIQVGDFLADDSPIAGQKFDRIVMNPPFEKNGAERHVVRAVERFLKPGGHLVAIVPRNFGETDRGKAILRPIAGEIETRISDNNAKFAQTNILTSTLELNSTTPRESGLNPRYVAWVHSLGRTVKEAAESREAGKPGIVLGRVLVVELREFVANEYREWAKSQGGASLPDSPAKLPKAQEAKFDAWLTARYRTPKSAPTRSYAIKTDKGKIIGYADGPHDAAEYMRALGLELGGSGQRAAERLADDLRSNPKSKEGQYLPVRWLQDDVTLVYAPSPALAEKWGNLARSNREREKSKSRERGEVPPLEYPDYETAWAEVLRIREKRDKAAAQAVKQSARAQEQKKETKAVKPESNDVPGLSNLGGKIAKALGSDAAKAKKSEAFRDLKAYYQQFKRAEIKDTNFERLREQISFDEICYDLRAPGSRFAATVCVPQGLDDKAVGDCPRLLESRKDWAICVPGEQVRYVSRKNIREELDRLGERAQGTPGDLTKNRRSPGAPNLESLATITKQAAMVLATDYESIGGILDLAVPGRLVSAEINEKDNRRSKPEDGRGIAWVGPYVDDSIAKDPSAKVQAVVALWFLRDAPATPRYFDQERAPKVEWTQRPPPWEPEIVFSLDDFMAGFSKVVEPRGDNRDALRFTFQAVPASLPVPMLASLEVQKKRQFAEAHSLIHLGFEDFKLAELPRGKHTTGVQVGWYQGSAGDLRNREQEIVGPTWLNQTNDSKALADILKAWRQIVAAQPKAMPKALGGLLGDSADVRILVSSSTQRSQGIAYSIDTQDVALYSTDGDGKATKGDTMPKFDLLSFVAAVEKDFGKDREGKIKSSMGGEVLGITAWGRLSEALITPGNVAYPVVFSDFATVACLPELYKIQEIYAGAVRDVASQQAQIDGIVAREAPSPEERNRAREALGKYIWSNVLGGDDKEVPEGSVSDREWSKIAAEVRAVKKELRKYATKTKRRVAHVKKIIKRIEGEAKRGGTTKAPKKELTKAAKKVAKAAAKTVSRPAPKKPAKKPAKTAPKKSTKKTEAQKLHEQLSKELQKKQPKPRFKQDDQVEILDDNGKVLGRGKVWDSAWRNAYEDNGKIIPGQYAYKIYEDNGTRNYNNEKSPTGKDLIRKARKVPDNAYNWQVVTYGEGAQMLSASEFKRKYRSRFKGESPATSNTRTELIGKPRVSGFAGPMWGGVKDGKPTLRYEEQRVHDQLTGIRSRTAEKPAQKSKPAKRPKTEPSPKKTEEKKVRRRLLTRFVVAPVKHQDGKPVPEAWDVEKRFGVSVHRTFEAAKKVAERRVVDLALLQARLIPTRGPEAPSTGAQAVARECCKSNRRCQVGIFQALAANQEIPDSGSLMREKKLKLVVKAPNLAGTDGLDRFKNDRGLVALCGPLSYRTFQAGRSKVAKEPKEPKKSKKRQLSAAEDAKLARQAIREAMQ